MEHAHVCKRCEMITIFAVDATYPRRCRRCASVLHLHAPEPHKAVREAAVTPPLSRAAG